MSKWKPNSIANMHCVSPRWGEIPIVKTLFPFYVSYFRTADKSWRPQPSPWATDPQDEEESAPRTGIRADVRQREQCDRTPRPRYSWNETTARPELKCSQSTRWSDVTLSKIRATCNGHNHNNQSYQLVWRDSCEMLFFDWVEVWDVEANGKEEQTSE